MGGRGYRPDDMGWTMGGGWWVGGLIGFLVLAALVAAVIVLLVKLNRARAGAVAPGARPGVAPGVAPAAGPVPVPRDALALLDERLARGDIDVADYEARRRALTGQPAPGASETRVDPIA